jgi:hypothetical protein
MCLRITVPGLSIKPKQQGGGGGGVVAVNYKCFKNNLVYCYIYYSKHKIIKKTYQ